MAKWEEYGKKIINAYTENETFSKEELEYYFESKIHPSTWKALFTHKILIGENNIYSLTSEAKDVFIKVKSKNNSKSGHSKDKNQDFGKYFEKCVATLSQGGSILPDRGYECKQLTDEDMLEVWNNAPYVLPLLNGQKANWIGGNTVNGNGDLVLEDGSIIELKYLSTDNSGTYFNGSIYNLVEWGFNLKNYFEEFNYYDLLENTLGKFGFHPNRKNKSPYSENLVSSKSPILKEEEIQIYLTKVLPTAEEMMKKFTQDVYDFFLTHKEKLLEFISFCLNKNEKKTMPDRLIAFNYVTNTVHEFFDIHNIENTINLDNIVLNEKGINIDNKIRVQFSWKNGYGIYNPAMYVFL